MEECLNHFKSKTEYDVYMESYNTESYDKKCQQCPNMIYDYNQGIIICKKFNQEV